MKIRSLLGGFIIAFIVNAQDDNSTEIIKFQNGSFVSYIYFKKIYRVNGIDKKIVGNIEVNENAAIFTEASYWKHFKSEQNLQKIVDVLKQREVLIVSPKNNF